jgi:ubiquitin-conjugating enzyme E2 M
MRVQKDLQDTKTKTPGYRVELPNKDDLLHLTVQMTPQDGFYAGGKFDFTMDVPQSYPHEPPKVHCHTRIFHPNIDTEGNVCLNILKADWKPVLSLQHVLFGLELLFAEPNPEDPLNRDAAELLRRDRSQFAQQVKRTMHGYYS